MPAAPAPVSQCHEERYSFKGREMRKAVKGQLTAVFEYVRSGCSLFCACKKAGLTTREFYKCLGENGETKENFLLALSDYADQCMDDIRSLAASLKAGDIDNSTAKLLIETNKWLALKACPEEKSPLVEMENGDSEQIAEIVVKFI